MLKLLKIKNFALIKSTEVEFCNKLNIISGETGAGKSILLGAFFQIIQKLYNLKMLHKDMRM